MDIKEIKNIFSNREDEMLNIRRKTALLIPLMEINGEINIIFERRSEYIPQPLDIAFPGGHLEEGESFRDCAIRETSEELGVDIKNIEVFGILGTNASFNGLLSKTFVGEIKNINFKDFKPDPKEVKEIIPIPLKELLKINPMEYTANIISQKSEDFPYHLIVGGRNYKFFRGKEALLFYVYKDIAIWGYTAGLLKRFMELIN